VQTGNKPPIPKARETRDTRHTCDMVAVGGHSLYPPGEHLHQQTWGAQFGDVLIEDGGGRDRGPARCSGQQLIARASVHFGSAVS